jgi:arylsulfatase A
MPMFIRMLLCFSGLLVLAFLAGCPVAEPSGDSRPNFVLIMADDLGYGDLSCYGHPSIRTPHLDRLAAEGIRFTDYHSNGAVCSPTRAALLSGMYQQRVGIPGVVFTKLRDSAGLAPEVETLAEVFHEAGYMTGIFGKWHLGYRTDFSPRVQGFDVFRGFVAGNVDYHSHLDNEHVFDWWQDTTLQDDPGYTTDLITGYAVDFLYQNKDQPFVLYIPYAAPHDPYQGRGDAPIRQQGKENREVAPGDLPGIYREMVEVMDEGVGQLMQTLADLGLDERTVVIFCSDNGANKNGSNASLRDYKGSLYEGGHRVPAIARWKGRIDPAQISAETVLSMDLLPTMAALAGIPARDHWEGQSIEEVLLQRGQLPDRDLFWSYNKQQVIRQGDWKLIISGEKVELFHLGEDPGEKTDQSGAYPERVAAMRMALQAWQGSWE